MTDDIKRDDWSNAPAPPVSTPERNRKKIKVNKAESPKFAAPPASGYHGVQLEERKLCDIASQIKGDWKNIYFGAQPYIDAMSSMVSIDDRYGEDSGVSVVAYFLANAGTWKGPVARNVKDELKKMLKKRGMG